MSSSSSDFSSDEDDTLMTDAPTHAPHQAQAVHVEVVPEDGPNPEQELPNILTALQDHVPQQLLDAMEPITTSAQQPLSYEAFATALYYLSALWPEEDASSGAVQRGLHRLRAAVYRRFHAVFPLTAEMFRQWVSDVEAAVAEAEDEQERPSASASYANRERLHLYALAQQDYWSVPLAMQHLQLLNEQAGSDAVTWGTLEAAMEHALKTVGQHYTQGHELWQLCRELIGEHYDQLASAAATSEADAAVALAKEHALRQLFQRQMQLPLQHNDLVMSEFRAWNQYNTVEDNAVCTRAIRDAEQRQQRELSPVYKKLNQFEDRLVASAGSAASTATTEQCDPVTVWMQYLSFARHRVLPLLTSDQQQEPAHRYMCCLFERAVAAVCLSSTLWLRYIEFVSTEAVGDGADQRRLCHRAVRNVPFDSAVWVEYLCRVDDGAATDKAADELTSVVDTELLARTSPPVMDSTHAVRVLVTYSGMMRRRLLLGPADAMEEGLTTLQAVFTRCSQFLETVYPSDNSAMASLLEFQAQCWAHLYQSSGSDTAKQLLLALWTQAWQQILYRRGDTAEIWIRYYDAYHVMHVVNASTERSSGTQSIQQRLREEVFGRAMQYVKDYPLAILERWLLFELAAGNDRRHYLDVRDRHRQLSAKLASVATTASSVAVHPTTTTTTATTTASSTTTKTTATAPSKKRKEATGPMTAPPEKKQKAVASDKAQRFSNDHTLFVCQLAKEATQDEVTALFRHIPSLQEVRLIVKERAHHAKSRGMAYVQFTDESGVAAGLLMHGQELRGQAIKVTRSTPPPTDGSASKSVSLSTKGGTKGKPAAKASSPSTTLYVGGLLPEDRASPITSEEVQSAMERVLSVTSDAIKQVLILTDKRGRPKDYALVEFQDHSLILSCLHKQEELRECLGSAGITVKESRMTIAHIVRHRDTQKQEVDAIKAKTTPTTEGGGSSRSRSGKPALIPKAVVRSTPHSRPTTRLAGFTPRALRKPTSTAASTKPKPRPEPTTSSASTTVATATEPKTASTTTSTAEAPRKSNADFRQLFLSSTK